MQNWRFVSSAVSEISEVTKSKDRSCDVSYGPLAICMAEFLTIHLIFFAPFYGAPMRYCFSELKTKLPNLETT